MQESFQFVGIQQKRITGFADYARKLSICWYSTKTYHRFCWLCKKAFNLLVFNKNISQVLLTMQESFQFVGIQRKCITGFADYARKLSICWYSTKTYHRFCWLCKKAFNLLVFIKNVSQVLLTMQESFQFVGIHQKRITGFADYARKLSICWYSSKTYHRFCWLCKKAFNLLVFIKNVSQVLLTMQESFQFVGIQQKHITGFADYARKLSICWYSTTKFDKMRM